MTGNLRPVLSCLAVLLSSGVALADCGPVAATFEKLAVVPAYRQLIDMGTATAFETLAIGDTLYAKTDGSWNKVQLKPGGRKAVMKQFFDSVTVKQCSDEGDVTIEAGAMRVYAYELPPIPGLSPTATPQKLWVGVEDGLPHRLESDGTIVDITYGDFAAPIP